MRMSVIAVLAAGTAFSLGADAATAKKKPQPPAQEQPAPAPTAAQPAAEAKEPAPTEIEQRLRIIERKLDNQADEAQAARGSGASFSDKGLSIRNGDGSYELKIKGLIQVDGRFFIGDDAGLNLVDGFSFRRIEPVIEATAGKLVYFKLQPQFAGDTASLADAYGELRFAPAFVVRAGKYKEPLILENLAPANAIEFNERGFPTELSGNRDLGLQFGGELLAGTTSYALGIVNGAPDGRDAAATDTDNRKEGTARLFFEPFKNGEGVFKGFGFGVAGSDGVKLSSVPAGIVAGSSTIATVTNNYNNTLPRYRSPGQNTVFSYRIASAASATVPTAANTVVADGTHLRWSPQLYWYLRGFGLLGEYIVSKQDVALAGTAKSFQNKAWQGVASYVITGEDANYRGVKPAAPYTAGGEGWGALEVAVRYNVLDPDDAAFAGTAATSFADPSKSVARARDMGVGVNWYLTGNAKLSLDYDETKFTGGAGTFAAPTNRDREQALFSRLQVYF